MKYWRVAQSFYATFISSHSDMQASSISISIDLDWWRLVFWMCTSHGFLKVTASILPIQHHTLHEAQLHLQARISLVSRHELTAGPHTAINQCFSLQLSEQNMSITSAFAIQFKCRAGSSTSLQGRGYVRDPSFRRIWIQRYEIVCRLPFLGHASQNLLHTQTRFSAQSATS